MRREPLRRILLTMKTPTSRPEIISAICILFFLGVLLKAAYILSHISTHTRDGVFQLLELLVALLGLVGLWRMKRWGVCLFVAGAIVNASNYTGNGNFLNTILLGFVLLVFWKHADKMS